MIKPTVGRKVWYQPTAHDKAGAWGMSQYDREQALDATVICVFSDRCVNLHIIDHAGKPFTVTSCQLLQDDDIPPRDLDGNPVGGYAVWMPYQVGTAAKSAVTITGDVAVVGDIRELSAA